MWATPLCNDWAQWLLLLSSYCHLTVSLAFLGCGDFLDIALHSRKADSAVPHSVARGQEEPKTSLKTKVSPAHQELLLTRVERFLQGMNRKFTGTHFCQTHTHTVR